MPITRACVKRSPSLDTSLEPTQSNVLGIQNELRVVLQHMHAENTILVVLNKIDKVDGKSIQFWKDTLLDVMYSNVCSDFIDITRMHEPESRSLVLCSSVSFQGVHSVQKALIDIFQLRNMRTDVKHSL